VIRGGPWSSRSVLLHAWYRFRNFAVDRSLNIGFRLAPDIEK